MFILFKSLLLNLHVLSYKEGIIFSFSLEVRISESTVIKELLVYLNQQEGQHVHIF